MGYRDVTDRTAVIAALHEYDALGADGFRAAHGFGPATQYVLVHEGKQYDSKAIVGVAHGYQFPTQGPLSAAAFSGGDATVVPVLEALGFTVVALDENKPSTRNPPWTRDELILAIDLYLRLGYLDDTHPAVIELSNVLQALPIHAGTPHAGTFRNPNGVTMKLGNIARLDPTYNGKGLDAESKLDEVVWKLFVEDREEMHRLAGLLRAGAVVPDVFPMTPEPDEHDVEEGRLLYRYHRQRERSAKVVALRKRQALERDGALACEVCGFDFTKAFGELGDGYIECHHIVPLSEAGLTKTKPSDLSLLCANCHRMAHRGRPWKSVAELWMLVSAHAPSA